jgi:ribosomal protein S18 acetylase RimI-like enzyme
MNLHAIANDDRGSVMLVMLATFSIQVQKFELSQQAAIAARAFGRGEPLELIESWFRGNVQVEFEQRGQLLCATALRKVTLLGFAAAPISIAAEHCARESGL